MKNRIALLSIALLFGSNAVAAETETGPAYEYNLTGEDVELTFKVARQPMFPHALKSEGYLKGKVSMLLEISHDGELRDWIVIQADHEKFAESVERVIRDWDFSPPKWKGNAISVVTQIEVNFESSGDIVYFDLTSGYANKIMSPEMLASRNAIGIADFDHLDEFPSLIRTVDPEVSRSLLEKYGGGLGVFRFFIDTEGKVRMPYIDRVEGNVDVRLLEAAQDALEQWQFTPPTVKGRKVVVELAQPFTFDLPSNRIN